MGVKNYLIEGGSGTGKTTVAEELQRRGYHVVHGDRQFAYYGDPETGAPVSLNPFDNEADNLRWAYDRWIWPVDEVKRLVADQSNRVTFFCGHSANFRHFIGLFDQTFVLDVDLETLSRRLLARPEDEFGGRAIEQALVTLLHQSRQGLPEHAIAIDATAHVARVADAILAHCDLAP